MNKVTDELSTRVSSIGLIGPDLRRRDHLAAMIATQQGYAVQQLGAYPEIDDLPRLLQAAPDVLIVDLDSNPELALDLVETICTQSSATVMVYSGRSDPELLVRCMRAGAREFLTEPLTDHAVAEALVRATVRKASVPSTKKVDGKLFVFVGAKGGSGVTTIATNFAVALAEASEKRTLLIDLNLPLGDAALSLGIIPQYSITDALQNQHRLDFNFLETLLAKHSSGLLILAAPDRYTAADVSSEAVQHLLSLARQNFDYIVVDGGPTFGQCGTALFSEGASIYLVTQVGISELRNANRLVESLKGRRGIEVEVVLNRFGSKQAAIDEASIETALTREIKWKIPSDFKAVQQAQHTATPLTARDSAVSRAIRQMSREAAGLPAPTTRKGFRSLFG